MKKTILTILFAITSIIAFGQARLGSSYDDVRSEFLKNNYPFKAGLDDDWNFYIILEAKRAIFTYHFNSELICNLILITPYNLDDLDYFEKLYNKEYTIVSSKQWKMRYSEYGFANIESVYTEDGEYFIRWSPN